MPQQDQTINIRAVDQGYSETLDKYIRKSEDYLSRALQKTQSLNVSAKEYVTILERQIRLMGIETGRSYREKIVGVEREGARELSEVGLKPSQVRAIKEGVAGEVREYKEE